MQDARNRPALSKGRPLRGDVRAAWARQGSNLRPPRCKRGALPLSYSPDEGDYTSRTADRLGPREAKRTIHCLLRDPE